MPPNGPVEVTHPAGTFGDGHHGLGRLTACTLPDGRTHPLTVDGATLASVALDGITRADHHVDPAGVLTGATLGQRVTEPATTTLRRRQWLAASSSCPCRRAHYQCRRSRSG